MLGNRSVSVVSHQRNPFERMMSITHSADVYSKANAAALLRPPPGWEKKLMIHVQDNATWVFWKEYSYCNSDFSRHVNMKRPFTGRGICTDEKRRRSRRRHFWLHKVGHPTGHRRAWNVDRIRRKWSSSTWRRTFTGVLPGLLIRSRWYVTWATAHSSITQELIRN